MIKSSNPNKEDSKRAKKRKLGLLSLLTVFSLICLLFIKPIPQSQSYHNFSDTRTVWNIPNFANVISNAAFIITSLYGFLLLLRIPARSGTTAAYWWMSVGIFLTAVGSSYYHTFPTNNTLVYDRIPMTLVFMSLLSIVVSDFVDPSLGGKLLYPLLLIGIFSVLWWKYTEAEEKGDLRLYGWVQFYPVVFIPLILSLFYNPKKRKILVFLGWAVAWYVVAKLFEVADQPIFSLFSISGHTLKHIAAAFSTWFLVKTYQIEHSKNAQNS